MKDRLPCARHFRGNDLITFLFGVYQYPAQDFIMTFMKIFPGMAASLFLAGCIPYPVYKTLQPYAEVRVVDESGSPVTGAKVNLISSSYPYGFERFRVVVKTDNGHAEFNKVKDFCFEVFFLHGAQFYFWNWCIEKEGYETITTHYSRSDQFNSKPVFILEPGVSQACSINSFD
ncbi:MAG: hypothetical protein LBJ59_04785 [Zoogloeaceae bacterium]|jgi:hypothetical protein|nr:hypothetical protein [Zoogloeaceae bacterium]